MYVVWVVLLLSLFAVGVGSQALGTVNLSERLSEQLRCAYVVRAGLQMTALALENDSTPSMDGLADAWADNPLMFQDHDVAGVSFQVTSNANADGRPRYGLQDEERRINLNTAPEDVLKRLLEREAVMHEDDAVKAAAAIIDWRDDDTDEQPDGAEQSYYQSLRQAYDCKDGPFENVEELLLVRGISPTVYQRVEPWVTVYGSGLINLNTAGEPVLYALGLSAQGVSGLLSYRSGEDGTEMTSDDRALISVTNLESDLQPYVPTEDLARLSVLVREKLLSVRSEAFRFHVQAQTPHAWSRMEASGVLDRAGRVVLWTER